MERWTSDKFVIGVVLATLGVSFFRPRFSRMATILGGASLLLYIYKYKDVPPATFYGDNLNDAPQTTSDTNKSRERIATVPLNIRDAGERKMGDMRKTFVPTYKDMLYAHVPNKSAISPAASALADASDVKPSMQTYLTKYGRPA